MSRYYHVLRDDGRRCNRCERWCQIFGSRDVASGWTSYCIVCNRQWYAWYLNTNICLCDRGCRDNGLFQILGKQESVEITTNFVLGRRPEEVYMEYSLRHLFALVQLSWLSCPLEWYYEDTDSEAEEERYQRPMLRTLREIVHVNWKRNPMESLRPRLLDLVCTYLYCEQARIYIARVRPTQLCGRGARQQLDWHLFTDGSNLWLWRASTEECFYIDRPSAPWRRYVYWSCTGDRYWWHNDEYSAWFFEPKG